MPAHDTHSWGEGGFIDIVTLRHYLLVDVLAQVTILLPLFILLERIDKSARPNNFRRNADVPEKERSFQARSVGIYYLW